MVCWSSAGAQKAGGGADDEVGWRTVAGYAVELAAMGMVHTGPEAAFSGRFSAGDAAQSSTDGQAGGCSSSNDAQQDESGVGEGERAQCGRHNLAGREAASHARRDRFVPPASESPPSLS